MNTLIRLELKKNKIQTYILASLIIAVTMLGFLFLFAYAPMLEPNDKDMAIFSGYNNLIPLFAVFNMAVFCVLSAVMYSKLVIEAYSGKCPILLFSYPVRRKKMILAKLSVVSGFTIVAMTLSNFIIYLIFAIAEKFIHLVGEDFTFSIMLKVVENTLVMACIASSIGIVAVGIGLIKKSVPTTIISAVLLASLMCNIVVNATLSRVTMYALAIVIISIGMMVSIVMTKKINVMEVE